MPPIKSLLALLLLTSALAVVAPPTASAATVTSTKDSGPGSLRQAVIDAAPGETINVPAGTYTLTSGEILVTENVTIAGAGAGSTNIRPGSSRAFLNLFGADLTISGMTFRDAIQSGGGIGGGIITSLEAPLTLSGVEFIGNHFDSTLPNQQTGGIQGGLIQAFRSDLTVLDSKFAGNTFDAGGTDGEEGGFVQGGAIYHTGVLTMARTSISGNVLDAPGGPGPVTEGQGGGFAVGGMLMSISEEPGGSTIRSSSVSGNSIDVRGGPGGEDGTVLGTVYLAGEAIGLTETTIASNSVRAGTTGFVQGGGAYLASGEGGAISVLSSTFAANSIEAGDEGLGGNLAVTDDGVSFANSVVAGGIGRAGSENCFVPAGASVVSKGFNLDSRDQCGFRGPGDIVNRDPQLGPLAENGGPTPTMLPALTSPLVDQGAAFGLSADQRGLPRPIDFLSIPNSPAPGGDGSDIGAVELQPSNAFSFGELKKHRKKGTAQLTVNIPAPVAGTLTLAGKGLKTRTVAVGASPKVTFVVATMGKAKKALRKRGQRKVAINVTYTPVAAGPLTQTRKTKLVRKKPRPKGDKEKPSKARG